MMMLVICIAAVVPSDGYAPLRSPVRKCTVRRLSSRHPLATTAIVRTSPAQPYSGVAGSSDRVHQRSVALFGSLPGFACYALVLRNVCLTPLFTPTWCVNQLVLMATSLMLAASLLPMMVKGLDARMGVRFWTVLSGAHIFASTAPAVLFAMLTPILSSTASTVLIAFSGVLITIGGLAEIYAHCLDGWWFHEGAEAADGGPNKVFSVCLVGSFAFLALATSPSMLGLLGACALPATVAAKALAAKQPWKQQKPFVYASQGVASMLTCVALGVRLRSLWPLLYFVQSFTIVRNGKRILQTGEQHLHCLPSVYGWFSYVVPFGLAVHPATTAAPLLAVAAVGAVSVWATGALEDAIVNWAGASRVRDTQLDALDKEKNDGLEVWGMLGGTGTA